MNEQTFTTRERSNLVMHAFIIIMIGFFGGFAWLLNLAGAIELWPLPPLDLSVPETKDLWENAHLGPIMNGIFLLAIVSVSSLFTFSDIQKKWVYWCALVMVWGNAFGYQGAPFASQRGLVPRGELINVLVYASFYIAALAAIILVVMCIIGALKTKRLNPKENTTG